jgi:hypothetical protein
MSMERVTSVGPVAVAEADTVPGRRRGRNAIPLHGGTA